jgi:hypothetical protein
MLAQAITRPSASKYSSHNFFVPKGEGDFRLVVDYRALNKKIRVKFVPLPDIYSCFHWFRSAKFFASLELNSASYQIGFTERSAPFMAFASDWKLHEYVRVAFHMATGARVLTRLLDHISILC